MSTSPSSSLRTAILAVVAASPLLGIGCSFFWRPPVGPVPIHEALQQYFGGGYVAYALPGTGSQYEAGTIIRYRNKAEVIVRPREDCFPLAVKSGTYTAPNVEWTKNTNLDAALKLLFPQAAATTVSNELKLKNVESAQLQLGTLATAQIPDGDVRDYQRSATFPERCRQEYGKGNILILGIVGSQTVRYQFRDEASLNLALEATSKVNIGGTLKIGRSNTSSNTMEIVGTAPTILGYIPYELLTDATKGSGGPLEGEQITVDRALKLRSESGE